MTDENDEIAAHVFENEIYRRAQTRALHRMYAYYEAVSRAIDALNEREANKEKKGDDE
jgi:hypothetical protein